MKVTLFFVYLFVEVFVTITIASEIGFLYTFVEIILSAIFGLILLFSTPFKMADGMQNVFRASSFVALGFSSFLRVFAAFLLIFPGFFGDMLGVILFIGSILFAPKQNFQKPQNSEGTKNEEVIDVEIIDNNSDN